MVCLAILTLLVVSNVESIYGGIHELTPDTDTVIEEGAIIDRLWVGFCPSEPITVDFFGRAIGDAIVGRSSQLNIFRGEDIKIISVDGSASLNLYGGQINHLMAGDDSIVNVFGYDLNYANIGGSNGEGWISGFWTDDTPFSINSR